MEKEVKKPYKKSEFNNPDFVKRYINNRVLEQTRGEDNKMEIPRRFENKKEMIKEIQRILLQNDYNIGSVFKTTKYMQDNLKSNIEWLKEKGYPNKFRLEVIKKDLYVIEDGKKRKIKSATKEMLKELKKETGGL